MNSLWWREPTNLDPEQKRIFGLPATGRYYVTGPAGCGKTNLLLLRARYLAKRKVENYVVLVYNGPLEKFVTSDPKAGIDPEKVHTFVSWTSKQLWAIMGRNGFEDLPEDLDKRRPVVCARLLAHLRETGKSELIDTILVDEIQDYTPAEIELVGLMAKNVFLVGDIRQQIYFANTLGPALDKVVPKEGQIELRRHYRVAGPICRLADRIAKADKGHKPIFDGCCYDEKKVPSSPPKLIQAKIDQQLDIAAASIVEQLDAYPGELIGVMCPRNDEQIVAFLETQFPNRVTIQRSGNYQYFSADRPIVSSTLHNGKGLEFRCVHILATDRLKGMPLNRELIYTGVTRAKTSLAIYHDKPLLPYLTDALRAESTPEPPPSLDDLFE